MEEMNDRIIALETKVAFQEDLVEQLNKIISVQQLELNKLSLAVDQLKDVIKTQNSLGIKDQSQEVPPPHY